MATKIRKQIYIEAEQDRLLKRIAADTGVSEAELIRQAIDQHAQALRHPAHDVAAWDAEREFIDGLIAEGPLPGHRDWRREDLYDRAVLR